jgi:hypothetical protein
LRHGITKARPQNSAGQIGIIYMIYIDNTTWARGAAVPWRMDTAVPKRYLLPGVPGSLKVRRALPLGQRAQA